MQHVYPRHDRPKVIVLESVHSEYGVQNCHRKVKKPCDGFKMIELSKRRGVLLTFYSCSLSQQRYQCNDNHDLRTVNRSPLVKIFFPSISSLRTPSVTIISHRSTDISAISASFHR